MIEILKKCVNKITSSSTKERRHVCEELLLPCIQKQGMLQFVVISVNYVCTEKWSILNIHECCDKYWNVILNVAENNLIITWFVNCFGNLERTVRIFTWCHRSSWIILGRERGGGVGAAVVVTHCIMIRNLKVLFGLTSMKSQVLVEAMHFLVNTFLLGKILFGVLHWFGVTPTQDGPVGVLERGPPDQRRWNWSNDVDHCLISLLFHSSLSKFLLFDFIDFSEAGVKAVIKLIFLTQHRYR